MWWWCQPRATASPIRYYSVVFADPVWFWVLRPKNGWVLCISRGVTCIDIVILFSTPRLWTRRSSFTSPASLGKVSTQGRWAGWLLRIWRLFLLKAGLCFPVVFAEEWFWVLGLKMIGPSVYRLVLSFLGPRYQQEGHHIYCPLPGQSVKTRGGQPDGYSKLGNCVCTELFEGPVRRYYEYDEECAVWVWVRILCESVLLLIVQMIGASN